MMAESQIYKIIMKIGSFDFFQSNSIYIYLIFPDDFDLKQYLPRLIITIRQFTKIKNRSSITTNCTFTIKYQHNNRCVNDFDRK